MMYLVLKNKLRFKINENEKTEIEKMINDKNIELIKLHGVTFHRTMIDGIYPRERMYEIIKISQGMSKCEYNNWHPNFQQCDCDPKEIQRKEFNKKILETSKNCSICKEPHKGYIVKDDKMIPCDCIKHLFKC